MDSTMILAIVIMALGFMFAGLSSKYKIFSLFSLGPLWLLLVEFQTDILMAVVLAGLMLFNGYYAIWGGKYD